MRVPKVGFKSRIGLVSVSLRLSEITAIKKLMPEIDVITLKFYMLLV